LRESGTPNGGTREEKMYLMSRDGFAFLAMGFTGKKAAEFKAAYIRRFNDMEIQIAERDASENDEEWNKSRGCFRAPARNLIFIRILMVLFQPLMP
jgi:phage regulator Rha-like protein